MSLVTVSINIAVVDNIWYQTPAQYRSNNSERALVL